MVALLASFLMATAGGTQDRPMYREPFDEHSCVVRVQGKSRQIGSATCLRALPRRNLSGYMVVGPEESCFVPTLAAARRLADGPCKIDLLARHGLLPFPEDGNRKVYRVRLRVAGNGRKGFYGHGGATPYGYYIVALNAYRYVGIVEFLAASGRR